ncbi:hypothetical protein RO3G_15080 [Rhizopus delemar RA 99-880]|uniref:Uncharacterized protein n=1 Tax=Rhizopus delemar (strain RA 99-880 / ATCC MYA-4621 / FGSC 9543 / NRRL 43880) TaxID=246409 RepID=I1CPI9_RHIO9|nr:hypothetical protein RO3G_15080 [Rhizopus delemar RA 99-880]|eukprot:EIE90369.1 hypothetical protein RO3G_15080 [Rhizopus delemar RA 99-880]
MATHGVFRYNTVTGNPRSRSVHNNAACIAMQCFKTINIKTVGLILSLLTMVVAIPLSKEKRNFLCWDEHGDLDNYPDCWE